MQRHASPVKIGSDLVSSRFQGLFHSGEHHLSLLFLFTIGHQGDLALGEVLPDSSGSTCPETVFTASATPLSTGLLPSMANLPGAPQLHFRCRTPTPPVTDGLGCSNNTTTPSRFFSSCRCLMFAPRSPPAPMYSCRLTGHDPAGFPIRTSPDHRWCSPEAFTRTTSFIASDKPSQNPLASLPPYPPTLIAIHRRNKGTRWRSNETSAFSTTLALCARSLFSSIVEPAVAARCVSPGRRDASPKSDMGITGSNR